MGPVIRASRIKLFFFLHFCVLLLNEKHSNEFSQLKVLEDHMFIVLHLSETRGWRKLGNPDSHTIFWVIARQTSCLVIWYVSSHQTNTVSNKIDKMLFLNDYLRKNAINTNLSLCQKVIAPWTCNNCSSSSACINSESFALLSVWILTQSSLQS